MLGKKRMDPLIIEATGMKHKKPSKEQLMVELAEAQQLISDLVKSASERKQVEEALGNSEKQYRLIVDGIADLLHVIDGDLRILLTNKAFREWMKKLGLKEKVEGRTIFEVFPFLSKEIQQEYEKVFTTGDLLVTEEITTVGEQTYFTEVRKIPIYEGKKITRVITIVRDITKRKRAEEELKKHRDHLEELVRQRTAKLLGANELLKKEIEERKQAEDALRTSEEKYELYFSRSNDIMFSYDDQFRFLSISPNVERILGYKPKEMLGKTFLDLKILHPDDLDKAAKNARDVISGRMIQSSLYQFITKDGARIFGEVSGIPLKREGRVVSVISVARDITKHIEMEKALQESAEKYRIHFSLSNDVMFAYDNQFKVMSVSPNVERLLGYKPEELVGRTFQDLNVLHPDYMDEAVDNAVHVLSGETIYSSIYEFITRDGIRKFGEVSGVPLKREGHVVGVISVARDITDRIENSKLLQEDEGTAKALLNASPDVMILLDTSGTILALNKAAAERLGKNVKNLLGTCVFDHLPKNVARRRRIYFEQTINSDEPVRFKDENQGRLVLSSLYPVHDAHGKVSKIAVYARE